MSSWRGAAVSRLHVEIIDFGVADVEAAHGGLRVHGAVLGERYSDTTEVDEFRDVEDFLDVREHGVADGRADALPVAYAGEFLAQVFGARFGEAVGDSLHQENVVVAAALFGFQLFESLDEGVAYGDGEGAHDVAEYIFTGGSGEDACGVRIGGRNVVAEREAGAFRVLLACRHDFDKVGVGAGTARVEPDGILRLISDKAYFLLFFEYLNETLSNSISPFLTSVIPLSGDTKSLS